jgi:hypothetical protein
MAYSRDPTLAFDVFDSPIPQEQPQQQQPVMTYQNVTLLQPVLEGHFVGQRIRVLRVDWLQGTAETFADMDDALNEVRTFQGIWTCPRVAPETVTQYVTETLRFLQRGHSLLDPRCTCRHWLSAERCRHLGITFHRPDWCSLSRAPCEISAAQLARELAVEDICRLPGLPFISAMERLCTIRVTPQGLMFSPLGTYLGPVR